MWRRSRREQPVASQARIVVSGVHKRFGDFDALGGVDLVVEPGQLVCLLGPSGCGKTTLLRCIAGLERPDAGVIRIGETTMSDADSKRFVAPERRGLGMVFQHYALWPHMTVAENIAYPLRKRGVPRERERELIDEVTRLVGLDETLDRRPGELSGGQQQRVALARALVHEPPALLLDEPLSNLDAILRRQLRREIRRLHERLGTTSIHVTHDQEEAGALADVIVVMQDGHVVQSGTHADIFRRPRTRFVAEFVGFDNFVPAKVVGANGAGRVVALAAGSGRMDVAGGAGDTVAGGDDVLVAARSDALRLAPVGSTPAEGGAVSGVIERITRLGPALEYEVRCGAEVLVVRQNGDGPDGGRQPGEEVTVEIPSTSPLVLR